MCIRDSFYTDYGRTLQLRFFDWYLKGKGDWKNQPKVQLQVRHVDRFVERHENQWPIARTKWTKMYLSGGSLSGSVGTPETVAFDAMGEGLTFLSEPLQKQTEITGPVAAKLRVSSLSLIHISEPTRLLST